MQTTIPIVDLFAGPGGLGEGFSSFNEGKDFKIIVSAEMESSAHQTLKLRAFYRILKNQNDFSIDSYYKFCNGESLIPFDKHTVAAWYEAGQEAQQITLGKDTDNHKLYDIIRNANLDNSKPWVLIGGPPCQAYSIVGRSRNKGKADYVAENDERHYLYREYLKTIQMFKPAVFVMENVKGILSTKLNGKKIFHSILEDLADPDKGIFDKSGVTYKIYSLSNNTFFESGMNPEEIKPNDFVIKSENYGIPQARHRVILIGVRNDIQSKPRQLMQVPTVSVRNVIGNLPILRSGLTKQKDTKENWMKAIHNHIAELNSELNSRTQYNELSNFLSNLIPKVSTTSDRGDLRIENPQKQVWLNSALKNWYYDKRLNKILNHESRGHMVSDLRRYLYASAYATVYGTSPKGHKEFDLFGLRPDHENWESGKFSDRFRVQLYNRPSTTITSHISKDGHYFIHPDPAQCRSLTVREAARLQTFPDNYFFQGNRTQQYHQVGNAVPPLLASKIAEIVSNLLK